MDEKAPELIKDLVERFERNLSSYKNQGYNEAQLRQEFINPFFEALGWDVYNKGGAAPAYRDVIHEDSIKIASGTKAPDYCFTLSGRRMFFVETKKPSVGIINDANPAYQLRRYAWSAKLPLSILTNFEVLCIYESRQKPHVGDKSNVERVKHIKFTEYIEKWDEIASVFSYDAVKQGSFDRFAQSMEKKRGTQEVGQEFLKEIEEWRENLAKNIAIRNPNLGVRELNFCIQKIIDRIIFLRMCEDRGIETYGQLRSIAEKDHIYENLCKIFEKADGKYNSGLFHFRKEKQRNTLPDELTLSLSIDDAILKNIFRHLYYPNSPYEFSVLPPEILGNVYEQFLGKLIRLTESHRAKVEEKPEVKKAGGVYYTPKYIVDYIVQNTVGKVCEGKTPKQISTLHILDPACGSGSFLLGAYTYLLRYHLDYYTDQKNIKRFKEEIYQRKDGQRFLTIKEKKRILLNNIYGVDIDNQAVEVTKLSLLLKVLEGTSKDIFEQQQKLWIERALPDLDNNIKCGNSLIGPDFYDNNQTKIDIDNNEIYRINAFDWNIEFKEIMENGGFDVVIGNPPYVRQEMLTEQKEYFKNHYKVFQGTADLYSYFIEKGISLLGHEGIFSYIVSNKWLRAHYGKPLRQWLKNKNIKSIIDFGDLPVFTKATTYPCILVVSNNSTNRGCKVAKIDSLDFNNLGTYIEKNAFIIKSETLNDEGWSLTDTKSQVLIQKLFKKGIPLGEYIHDTIYRGIITGLNKAFVIDEDTRINLIKKDIKNDEIIKPFLAGRNVKRYMPPETRQYLIFTRQGIAIEKYPTIVTYLEKYKAELMPKSNRTQEKGESGRKPGSYKWFEIQDTIDYFLEFEKPKIVFPNICKKPEFTFDETKLYTNQKCFIIPLADKYLLGILNSSLTYYLFQIILPKLRGGFYEPSYVIFKKFPIHTINFADTNEKTIHTKIVTLVEQMLSFHGYLAKAKTDNEKITLRRQIDATDQQIDKLVYELYSLTKKEIAIVEESLSVGELNKS